MSADPADPYVYPGTTVLRNSLGITDAEALDRAERRFSTDRAAFCVPTGDFDLKHLQAIHGHLFQDVYDWAGKTRTVEISKDGSQFQFRQYIETGMADVHRRIVAARYFKGTSPESFADQAGRIMGDVNYVHPFRDGNGRTQLLYLQQLASRAGQRLDLRRLDRDTWMEASRQAHRANYRPMSEAIGRSIDQDKTRERDGRERG